MRLNPFALFEPVHRGVLVVCFAAPVGTTLTAKRDWFGSTTGPDRRKRFNGALVERGVGSRRKAPLLAKNARNGAPCDMAIFHRLSNEADTIEHLRSVCSQNANRGLLGKFGFSSEHSSPQSHSVKCRLAVAVSVAARLAKRYGGTQSMLSFLAAWRRLRQVKAKWGPPAGLPV